MKSVSKAFCGIASEGKVVRVLERRGRSTAPFVADGDAAKTAEALRFGIKAKMKEAGLRRVVIGVSGGIDSAVSTALYASVLPVKDILLVGMPGPFTSGTTRTLGRQLAENVGARFVEIPIAESVELTRRQLAEVGLPLSDFAIENVQARDRGSRILAACAAAFGGVVSCNANKTEITIGYGTMYGDIAGWLCCLGDLWKGDVYAVGRYLNEEVFRREVVPEGIFKVKPSAELSAKQAVEKGLGDPLVYPYHDKLFRSWVERGADVDKCVKWYKAGDLASRIGYEGEVESLFPTLRDFKDDAARWWKLYTGLAAAKRLQAPPILAVTEKPFA